MKYQKTKYNGIEPYYMEDSTPDGAVANMPLFRPLLCNIYLIINSVFQKLIINI